MSEPGQTFAEKALARAAGMERLRAGQIVEVTPDWILSHDNTAAIAHIFRDELGQERVIDPDRLCITLDHAAPPPTAQHALNHAEVRAFVRQQGIRHFFEVGRGICHQVLSEEGLILPGQVILGADSHTTHYGWLGAFGAGIGRSEVAALWATGHIWLRLPEAIRIRVSGQLAPGVTSKDLCLYLIGRLGADGGLYASLEFDGPGLESLSLESRMVIPNMMAEFGVKNAYLPPDAAVFEYLAARAPVEGIEDNRTRKSSAGESHDKVDRLEAMALYPDSDAAYAAKHELRLEELEPLVACPPDVDNVFPLSMVAGQRVDMAFIGTCTNGRLEDLASAAEVLRGRHVSLQTRLLVIPASSQVYRQALETGVLETLVEAGAMIGVPGCGPCMGNHLGIPGPGEVVVSTANRNFKGRMGQPEAEIYLASPGVVAASAVLGRLAHPAEVLTGVSPASGRGNEGTRGTVAHPAFQSVSIRASGSPDRPSLPDGEGHASQKTVWKYGDNVNTDLLFPGKHTYTLRTPQEIAAHALEDLDPAFAAHVRPGDVVFGGSNFGCGSSREQAVTCLKYSGVSAVVAQSFSRIFYRNAINQGLPAVICPAAVQAARHGEPVDVDITLGLVRLPAGEFPFLPFPEDLGALLAAGGLIPFLRSKLNTAPGGRSL
jgi:3-isopropylmalate/(R)-2-methylmalate dehydratase large subunit